MRTLKKEISIEPMTSRLPSVWPSFFNNDGNIYCFDDDSLDERSYVHTSNWGMIPLNIVVTPVPNPNTVSFEYRVPSGETACDNESTFILSFDRLSKWYSFFTEYYNLLKIYGHCGMSYISAEDYYNNESSSKFSDQMKYGGDREKYVEIDTTFKKMGGKVIVNIYDKSLKRYIWVESENIIDKNNYGSIIDVNDNGFFKWICENVVPSFQLPMKYSEYWKMERLYYPDVVKWLAWFGKRLSYEEVYNNEDDTWDCSSNSEIDCCDCEEYFKRGGKRTYDSMKSWYDSIQSTIKDNDERLKSLTGCQISKVIMPIELQLSIDDLGELSILSKDYVLGEDYRVTRYGGTSNEYGGTVSSMNGESMYLDKDGTGYGFNEDCMEKYVSSCMTCSHSGLFTDKCPKCGSRNITQVSYNGDLNQKDGWVSYTERYARENKKEFEVSAVTYYTFDDDNFKVTTSEITKPSAVSDLRNKLAKKYKMTLGELGWFLVNGELCGISEAESAKYDPNNEYLGDKDFIVFREDNTNTPYTFINGKKVYAEFYPQTNEYYFPFFKESRQTNRTSCSGSTFNINDYKRFSRMPEPSDKIRFISYDNTMYIVDGDTDTIEGYDAYPICGYAVDSESNVMYCLSGSNRVMYYDEYVMYYPNATHDNNYVTVAFNKEFEVFSVDEITGQTVSKIYDLRLYNTLTDDIGNNIDGIYDISKGGIFNHQPPEGSVLDLIYQVGNTSNISRFSNTSENNDEAMYAKSFNGASALTNYFVGDIITEMDFYYKDSSGNRIDDTLYTVRLLPSDEIEISGSSTSMRVASTELTSLSAISLSNVSKEAIGLNSDVLFADNISCDITYYKGATLSRREGSTFNLASRERGDVHKIDSGSSKTYYYQNYGVEYNETVEFVKKDVEYYLKKPKDEDKYLPLRSEDPCNHSISYPVTIYTMKQDISRVENSQYDSDYMVALANFKTNINVFGMNEDSYSEKYNGEMARHNNLQVFPVYREEYKLGISSLENIDSDIYIDRGINAAFEKHIKLGEVTSLEALEQYGNHFFKMMNS